MDFWEEERADVHPLSCSWAQAGPFLLNIKMSHKDTESVTRGTAVRSWSFITAVNFYNCIHALVLTVHICILRLMPNGSWILTLIWGWKNTNPERLQLVYLKINNKNTVCRAVFYPLTVWKDLAGYLPSLVQKTFGENSIWHFENLLSRPAHCSVRFCWLIILTPNRRNLWLSYSSQLLQVSFTLFFFRFGFRSRKESTHSSKNIYGDSQSVWIT